MLRNREFRHFAILFSLIAAAAVALGFAINTAAGILAIAFTAASGTAFFAFTKARYKSIEWISDQIDLVLHNADHLYIGESNEGELSILQSEITKMTLRIREQNEALKKEKKTSCRFAGRHSPPTPHPSYVREPYSVIIREEP